MMRLSAVLIRGLIPSLGALPADLDPARDLRFVCTSGSGQNSLCPVARRQQRQSFLSGTQREPGVFAQWVRPVTGYCPKLGHGRVSVIDLTPGTVAAADAGDPGKQELISATHICSLELSFDMLILSW
jgi:hypothetical protein